MTTPVLVTGDDINISVTLKKNGVVFTIALNASVKARLVSTNHETPLSEEVAQASGTSGANWPQSLVVVVIPAATSKKVAVQGDALLEIQVSDAGKTTWFVPVILVKGHGA